MAASASALCSLVTSRPRSLPSTADRLRQRSDLSYSSRQSLSVQGEPGFHLHAWSGLGRMVTHAAAVGRFDGPYPFHDGGKLSNYSWLPISIVE
jgi:hypothetical protein